MIATTLDAISAATCYVKHYMVGTTMHWTLTGSDEAVQAKVDSLMRRYHPEGYGTRVTRHPDRVEVVAYSCD